VRAWLCTPLLCAPGCALQEGHGFATLERASLKASFEPEPARTFGDRVLSNQGYFIAVERFVLGLDALLLASLVSSGSAAFDPQAPPPGYSLCHSGHCHNEDGSLVSYEDIAAELAGGEQGFAPVATLPIEAQVDLLEPVALSLSPEPSRELPRTTIDRASLRVVDAELDLRVSGGPLSEETPIQARIAAPLTAAAVLDVVVDRNSDPHLALECEVRYGARLFDDLDFSRSEPGAASDTLTRALGERLAELRLNVSLK
jgi:hypothetical protein